jgi:hypothetical protein
MAVEVHQHFAADGIYGGSEVERVASRYETRLVQSLGRSSAMYGYRTFPDFDTYRSDEIERCLCQPCSYLFPLSRFKTSMVFSPWSRICCERTLGRFGCGSPLDHRNLWASTTTGSSRPSAGSVHFLAETVQKFALVARTQQLVRLLA